MAITVHQADLATLNEMKRWAIANPNKPCPFMHRILKVPDEDYFAFDAANQSLISWHDDSAAHCRARMLRKVDSDSPALAFGRAVHCAIFENEKFGSLYAVKEDKPKEPERPADLKDVTRRSAAGKLLLESWEKNWLPGYNKLVEEWEERNKGKTFLKAEEFEAIYQIAGKTAHDPFIRQFVEGGHSEVMLVAYHQEFRVWMKCKVDNLLLDKKIIVDLKTTRDTAEKFKSDLFKKDYDVQGAYYRDLVELALGIKVRANIILSVEKFPPYEPSVFMLSNEAYDLGREIYRRQLAQHAICLLTNRWEGYKREVKPVTPPNWKIRRERPEEEDDDTE